MWFYDVAECHVNYQLHGEKYVLRVLDGFIFSENWTRCIKLQKWFESVLCGPSAMVGISVVSHCARTVHQDHR